MCCCVAVNGYEDPLDLIMMDLSNSEVSLASKKVQKASDAPAIISVFTEEKIKALGIKSLIDILAYVPNVSVMETYWREPIVTVRGIRESLYNDKILLLINGIPAYEGVNGASYFEQIPVNAIKAIEIMRGTGSVLYGTNAFTGIINVVMKSDGEQKGLSVDVSGGSFGRRSVSATYSGKTEGEKPAAYLISGSCSNDDGYQKVFDYDERTQTFANGADTYTYDYMNNVASLYGSFKYKGLEVFGNYWAQQQNKFGMVPILGYGGLAKHEGFNIAAKYNYNITAALSYLACVRYTWM